MIELESCQSTLAQGQALRYEVPAKEPASSAVDTQVVWIQALPMCKVAPGDVVLCKEGQDARLRQVLRTRLLHGLPCLEVMLGDRSMVSRFVRESSYLGKVVPEAPALVTPGAPTPPPLSLGWWNSVVSRARSLVGR
jgi:hypothetical protein